jgi:hypothetical protein
MKRLLCIIAIVVLLVSIASAQTPDDTLIANLLRQIYTLQKQVDSLNQQLQKWTHDYTALQKQCGDRCTETPKTP